MFEKIRSTLFETNKPNKNNTSIKVGINLPEETIDDVFGASNKIEEQKKRMLEVRRQKLEELKQQAGIGIEMDEWFRGHHQGQAIYEIGDSKPKHYVAGSSQLTPADFAKQLKQTLKASQAHKKVRRPVEVSYLMEKIMALPAVEDIRVLFDDSPHEISLRVTMKENLWDSNEHDIEFAFKDLNNIIHDHSIVGVDRLVVTYTFKEVIE